MSTWNLDFGNVKHWEDFNLKHEFMQMKMEYDDSLSMPVTIELIDDERKQVQSSIELSVKQIQSPYGNIEVCGEIYEFTNEQRALIESVMSYWKFQTDDISKANYDSDIYLGLIMYYDSDKHEFILSDLEINKTTPIAMKIKEYDLTTKMVTKLVSITSEVWDATFVRFEDEYQLYNICGHQFLLNESQANYIDSL